MQLKDLEKRREYDRNRPNKVIRLQNNKERSQKRRSLTQKRIDRDKRRCGIDVVTRTRYICDICRDENVLQECECGCGSIIPSRSRYERLQRFRYGHEPVGVNHKRWKGGAISSDGYVLLSIRGKSIRRSKLVFEKYYKCCLLPDTDIYHINRIRTDDRIENLQPLCQRVRQIPPNRRCQKCNETKSRDWFRIENGYQCARCYSYDLHQLPHYKQKKSQTSKNNAWDKRKAREMEQFDTMLKRAVEIFGDEWYLNKNNSDITTGQFRKEKRRKHYLLIKDPLHQQKLTNKRRLRGSSSRKEHFCRVCLDHNLLIECKCRCGEIINAVSKLGRKKEYVRGHMLRVTNTRTFRLEKYLNTPLP